MAERARVTDQDKLFIELDRHGAPWTVHLEAWIAGTLDVDRLDGAIAAAVQRHPMARAALKDGSEWEIVSRVEPTSARVVTCAGETELSALRERLLSESPGLEAPSPFAFTLARCPDRDALIVTYSHSLGDGIGVLRLLASIFRSYAGEPDPLPDIDPLAMRDPREFAARRTLSDRLSRLRERSEQRERHTGEPVRIAPGGRRPDRVGGIHLIRLAPDEVEVARARVARPATFNDLLLAALIVAIRRWNDERGAAPGPVTLEVPVNIRPAEWSSELIANLAATLVVAIPPESQSDLATAQQAVAERTRRRKAQDFAEMLASGGVIPVWVRRLLGPLLPAPGQGPGATAVLSNLGRVQVPERLGPDLRVDALWISAPIRMPDGFSLTVMAAERGSFLTFHYGPELFDRGSAEAFGDRFADILLGG